MTKRITLQDTNVMYRHGKDAGKSRSNAGMRKATREAVSFASLAISDEESYSMRWWFGEGLRNYCESMDDYNHAMDTYDSFVREAQLAAQIDGES